MKRSTEHLLWYGDWALIKIASTRSFDNRVPATLPGEVKIEGLAKADRYVSIDPNTIYRVIKYGRTTEWTFGEINGAISYINDLRGDDSTIMPVDLTMDSVASPPHYQYYL
ncbi:hypothetical protein DPSP01_003588 [Paraphaeosphaeria sporulosa]